jgi:hypothetical protein
VERRHWKGLASAWLLGWLAIAYSITQMWPPSVAPHYIAVADSLKLEVEKFDKQTGVKSAATDAAGAIAEAERWKADPDELMARLWRQWAIQLVLFVLAVGGGLLLFAGKPYWEILCSASAAWYLSDHYFAPVYGIFFSGMSSFSEVLARIEIMARPTVAFAALVVYDVLIPIVCICMLACAAQSFARRQRNKI